jgi:hypothetical protein
MTRIDNSRVIRSPHGTELSAKSWLTEAPLRMLMNNLDPDVAEKPGELVVYGGIGRAARTWEDFDRICASLRSLSLASCHAPDELLLSALVEPSARELREAVEYIPPSALPARLDGLLAQVHSGSTGRLARPVAASVAARVASRPPPPSSAAAELSSLVATDEDGVDGFELSTLVP